MPEIFTDNLGNTYVFGATYDPNTVINPGVVGPVLQTFTGLCAGTTYEFILISFNGLGYSGYAGPITVYTLPDMGRSPVMAFAWTWPYEPAGSPIYYVSGSTQNWIPSSNDLTETIVWPAPSGGFSVYPAAEITPPAGMSAFGITFSGSGSKFGNQRYTYSNFVTAGITYTFSMYINVSQGLSQNFDIRIGDHFGINSGSPYSPRLQQVEPILGAATTNNSSYTIGFSSGSTGWTRVVVNVTPQLNQRLQIASFQINGSFPTVQSKPYYIAGLNFNEGITPSNFISTNIVPEVEDSQYGNTGQSIVYDGTLTPYLNFGLVNGLTYIYPLADAYSKLYQNKSWLSPSSKIKWRESTSLKRYVSIMKGLSSGQRAIYPRYISSPWLWALEDDKFALGATGGLALSFYDDDGNEITRPLCGNTYHGGLWIVNGICLGQNIWNQVMLDLTSQNANCDYFIHNQELVNDYFSSFEIFECTGNSLSIRNAIVNDSRYNQEFFGLTSWASYMSSNGACAYTIQDTVFDPNLSYLSWDNYGQALFRKAMDVMVSGYDTYDNGRFANSIQTDAYSFKGDGAINDGAPSIFGFHPINSMYVMGNAPSPILYGWYYSGWNTSVIYGSDMDKIKFSLSVGAGETRPSKYPIAWMPFLFDMQTLRLAKRGSPNLPMIPVIPSLRFVGNALILPGQTASDLSKTFAEGVTAAEPASWYADVNVGFNPQCGITFTQSGGNSAYFYELIRHACLTGVKGFDWWNNSSFWHAQSYGACYGNTFSVMNPTPDYVGYMKTGNTTYLQDMQYLNQVLSECNTQIGGYTLTSYITSRINYTTNYVISGAPGPTTGGIWRVTVKPGVTLLANGITLSSNIGKIGTWLSTPGPTLAGIGLTLI